MLETHWIVIGVALAIFSLGVAMMLLARLRKTSVPYKKPPGLRVNLETLQNSKGASAIKIMPRFAPRREAANFSVQSAQRRKFTRTKQL